MWIHLNVKWPVLLRNRDDTKVVFQLLQYPHAYVRTVCHMKMAKYVYTQHIKN